jgi:hypothetical protein
MSAERTRAAVDALLSKSVAADLFSDLFLLLSLNQAHF